MPKSMRQDELDETAKHWWLSRLWTCVFCYLQVAHDIDAVLQEKASNGSYGFSSRIKPCLEDLADAFELSFGYDRKGMGLSCLVLIVVRTHVLPVGT